VRDYIRKETRKLSITYLVTGPYSDLYIAKSPFPKAGTFDVKAKKAVLLGTGEEKVSFTTMVDVGRLLVAALKTPATTSPRVLKVNSFTATSKEIVAEFEKQTGAKWEASFTPLDELKKLESDAWERGDPLATPLTLRRIWTEGGTLYEKRDNWQIGEPAVESLEEQVKQTVAKQSAGS
jgi:nucleoside-diphosphate-sugar epimerase